MLSANKIAQTILLADQKPNWNRNVANNNYTGKRTLSEILADMEKPVEQQFISTKPIQGSNIAFISWPALCRLLNLHCAGFWEWKIRSACAGDRTIVEGSLTIHGSDGSLTREATGNEFSGIDKFGDPSSNAEAMALRRCCAKFGLGLELWEKSKTPKTSFGKQEWEAKFGGKK